jgi:hypothetical protein
VSEKVKLPPVYDHATWCRRLFSLGSLDRKHYKCMSSLVCVAGAYKPQEKTWRTPRHE